MNVNEQYKIHRVSYPYAEKLNPILHKIILDNAHIRDKGAMMTPWHCFDIKEFAMIAEWVRGVIGGFHWDLYTPLLLDPENIEMELYNLWGQVYSKNDYQQAHCHLPHHWSFVYYVNTPRGSSPLVFEQSKRKIYPKEGEVIIFPGWIRHYVPPNKCEGRSIIAGNFTYKKKN